MPEPIKNLMRLLNRPSAHAGDRGRMLEWHKRSRSAIRDLPQAMQILEQKTGAFGSRGDTVNVWWTRERRVRGGAHSRAISLPFPEIENSYQQIAQCRFDRGLGSNWNDVIAVKQQASHGARHSDIYTRVDLKPGSRTDTMSKGAPSEAVEEQAGDNDQHMIFEEDNGRERVVDDLILNVPSSRR